MKTLNIFFTAAIIATLTQCSGPTKEDITEPEAIQVTTVSPTDAQLKTIGLQTGQIEKRSLSGVVKVNGMLDVPPQFLTSISIPFGGFLRSTTMLQGMKVRKGDVIAEIENAEYVQLQQDYLDFSSQLDFLSAEYKRQEELAKENVNAQKTLQQSKSNYFSMVARVNGLKAKLALININPVKLAETSTIHQTVPLLSPIDGYVGEINANLGKYLGPTDVLMKIVNTEHLHAELTVFEKDVLKIKIGQSVNVMLANESKIRKAKVYLIGKQISDQRTVRIHCHLEDEDVNLLPGMYLTAEVETGNNLVDVLPVEAVVEYEGKQYVFVQTTATSKEYKMLTVKAGVMQNGFIEVSFDEQLPSDQIVVKGAFDLLSMMMNSEEEE